MLLVLRQRVMDLLETRKLMRVLELSAPEKNN
jgi:hypothetical protein